MKNNFLFCVLTAALLLPGILPAGTLSLSHKPGKAVVIGASESDALPVRHPEFKLQIFPQHFDVFIKAPLLPGEKLQITGKGNDDERMFMGDTAEFFISPDGKNYYQIAVNPAGFSYTARGRDKSWNPKIKTQVEKSEAFWRARFSIPYKEINTTPPAPQTVWRANFAAKVPTGSQRKSSSWSGARDFHKISEFGTIRFDAVPLPRLLYWNTDQDTLNAALYLPPQYTSGQVFCEVNGKKYPGKKSGSLCRWQVPLFDNYVFPKRFCFVKIALQNREGKVLYSRQGKAAPKGFVNFDINSFYYTPDMTELLYKQNFSPRAQLLLKNAGNHIISRHTAAASGKISLAGLNPGRYILELSAGKKRTSRLFKIVPENFKAASISPQARFEVKNGLFHLAGQPVFLVGGSSTPKNHLQFSPAFNMKTGNIGLIPNGVSFNGLGQVRFLRRPLSGSYLKKNADQIIEKHLSGKPAGNRQVNRLAYEAQIQLKQGDLKNLQLMDTPGYYARLYKKLKARYPEKYFSIHIDKEDQLDAFIKSCDIFEFASWRSSYAPCMMTDLVPDMKKIRQKAGPRPVVFWLGGSIPDPYCRMAEELRAAVYCAMICRINGVIFHLGHGGLGPERSRLWSLISGINAEIQPIYREFASGKEEKDFVKEVKGRFLWSVRRNKNGLLMVVVNLNGSEQLLDMKTSAGNIRIRLTPFEPLYIRFRK